MDQGLLKAPCAVTKKPNIRRSKSLSPRPQNPALLRERRDARTAIIFKALDLENGTKRDVITKTGSLSPFGCSAARMKSLPITPTLSQLAKHNAFEILAAEALQRSRDYFLNVQAVERFNLEWRKERHQVAYRRVLKERAARRRELARKLRLR